MYLHRADAGGGLIYFALSYGEFPFNEYYYKLRNRLFVIVTVYMRLTVA